jgi:hypothetical protein
LIISTLSSSVSLSDWVIINSGCSSKSNRLDPGDRFSFLGDETSICTAIAAAIFVHLIPSGNKGIGISLFERKSQLTLLFGSYSRKSKKSGVFLNLELSYCISPDLYFY